MKLSGFTFIRNAIKYDFPFQEAVESMLGLVDELVINIGKSEDGTETRVEELIAGWRKTYPHVDIKTLHSVWNDSKTDSGLVLSEQTNIALKACTGDWALYLQADEAIHEKAFQNIKKTIALVNSDSSIDGIRFRYLHFYGGYTLIQRPWNWYPSEIRLIRLGRDIQSYGDAQTFRGSNDRKLKTVLIDSHIFHYGHARHPENMKKKISYFHRFWHGDNHGIDVNAAYNLDYKNLVWYTGSHPKVYEKRMNAGLEWSPKPTREKFDVVILLGDGNSQRSLWSQYILKEKTDLPENFSEKVKTKLETLNYKVISAKNYWELISAYLQSAKPHCLIDLNLGSRCRARTLLIMPFIAFLFNKRIGFIREGSFSKLLTRFYQFIAWGSHENTYEGFRVPNEDLSETIAYWV